MRHQTEVTITEQIHPAAATIITNWRRTWQHSLKVRVGIFLAMGVITTIGAHIVVGDPAPQNNFEAQNSAKVLEMLARSNFFLQVTGSNFTDDQRMGEALKAMFAGVKPMRAFLEKEIKRPTSQCYGQTVESCIDGIVLYLLNEGLKKELAAPESIKPVLATKEDRLVLILFKAMRTDAARYPGAANKNWKVDSDHLLQSYERLRQARAIATQQAKQEEAYNKASAEFYGVK